MTQAEGSTRAVPTLHVARGFWQRLGGLLVHRPLRRDEALLLAPCSSVHTMFMDYEIDVVFLDAGGRVLKVVAELKPWRAAWCFGAASVLEMRAGQARAQGIGPNVRVNIAPRRRAGVAPNASAGTAR